MNDLDRTTFDQFVRRFAAVVRSVPEPPARSTEQTGPSTLRWAPIATAAAVVAVLLIGISILPVAVPPTSTPGPSASPSALPPTASPEPTTPTGDQPGHPQLGGTTWTIVEVDQEPIDVESWLGFGGGRSQGKASGDIAAECSFIAFDYSYPASGPGLRFEVIPDENGSYSEDCSPAAEAQYARLADALTRVTYWTMLEPDRLGLLGAENNVVIAAGPPPPLPTPPPGGDCGSIPQATCLDAATKAFNFGLNAEPGQTIVSWSVRKTIYTLCTGGIEPKFDVIFELENPTFEKIAVVGELYGRLVACGDY